MSYLPAKGGRLSGHVNFRAIAEVLSATTASSTSSAIQKVLPGWVRSGGIGLAHDCQSCPWQAALNRSETGRQIPTTITP